MKKKIYLKTEYNLNRMYSNSDIDNIISHCQIPGIDKRTLM
jgi:hypothetical protein